MSARAAITRAWRRGGLVGGGAMSGRSRLAKDTEVMLSCGLEVTELGLETDEYKAAEAALKRSWLPRNWSTEGDLFVPPAGPAEYAPALEGRAEVVRFLREGKMEAAIRYDKCVLSEAQEDFQRRLREIFDGLDAYEGKLRKGDNIICCDGTQVGFGRVTKIRTTKKDGEEFRAKWDKQCAETLTGVWKERLGWFVRKYFVVKLQPKDILDRLSRCPAE